MKIFGIQIGKSPTPKPVIIEDQVPEVKAQIPPTKKPTKIPAVSDPTLRYNATKARGRGMFQASEYDLSEIGRIEDSVAGHRCTIIKSGNQIDVVTFEELYQRYECFVESNNKDRIIDPNIETLTWENEKPCWKQIKQIIRHRVNKKGFAVYQKNGCTVVTADHSLIEKDTLREITALQLVETQGQLAKIIGQIPREIDHNPFVDIVAFVYQLDRASWTNSIIRYQYQGYNKQKGIIRELTIPRYLEKKDLLVVLGAYLSEGSVVYNSDTNRYGQFCISNSNINWLKNVQKSFDNLFGPVSKIKTYKDGISKLTCPRELIATLFANLGGYQSENKKIPSFCFSLNQEHASILLKYMIDGDGNRQSYGWSYTTKSNRLASGYSTLLRLLNINHTFNYRKNHGRIYYNIRTNLFYETKQTKTFLLETNFNNEYVYDLEVEDTHMFTDAAGQILLHNTDSYVRQAFGKKIGLMFKEGWDITGPETRVIKYIKARLDQIAQASNIPTSKLFRDIGTGLIKKSNCFLLKVRKTEASGGRIRTEPGKKVPLQPVAAYFVMPAETMQYQLSGNKIVKWQQKMPNGDIDFHAPNNVLHFYYDRKEGFVFGTPTLIPVVDDIRALRKIEENIELLVYQHLFPLFHYKVGTETMPASIDESGNYEVDVVRQEIMYMPTEGSIVTPERHEIKAIGSEGRALRAEGYLEHFKKRVFAGLGVSAVDMGEGETANRATADNMSRNLIDAVKDFQQVAEIFINEYIIKELLLESTFGEDILDDERRCYLKFKEIDVDAQIKKEAHNADQFVKGAITWDELRVRNGDEPIQVPTRQEMDSETDTADKYPQWHKTFWKLFDEPKLLIQSLDEPFSPTAKAVARSQSLEPTSADMDEAGQAQQDQEIALEKERTKAKIAVAKAKPKTVTRPSAPKRKDGYLANTFVEVKKDVVQRVSRELKLDYDWVGTIVRAQMTPTINRLITEQVTAFRRGYAQYTNVTDSAFVKQVGTARTLFRDRSERYINRLTENVISTLRRNVDNNDDITEIKAKTRAVFDTLQYRTTFIEDVEVRKAHAFGRVIGARIKAAGDIDVKVWSTTTQEDACTNCKARSGQLMPVTFITLEDVPPYHASCKCALHIEFTDTSLTTQDSAIDKPVEGDIPESDYTSCPKCGKTAIRKKDTPDIYNCRACKHSFRVVQDDQTESEKTEDGKLKKPQKVGPRSKRSQFTKCVMKAMSRLRAQHPDWDEDKLEMLAEAACDHLLQDSGDEEIEDGAKLERCVLRVKQRLRSEHPDWSDDKIKSSAFAICNASLKGK